MRLIETETGTGCARSGLHRSDGLALHTRGAAQSGPYDEWLSLQVRSYGTATLKSYVSTLSSLQQAESKALAEALAQVRPIC